MTKQTDGPGRPEPLWEKVVGVILLVLFLYALFFTDWLDWLPW